MLKTAGMVVGAAVLGMVLTAVVKRYGPVSVRALL